MLIGVNIWMKQLTAMISRIAESPATFSPSMGSQDDTRFQALVGETGDGILNLPGYPGIDFDTFVIQLLHGCQINASANHRVHCQFRQPLDLG